MDIAGKKIVLTGKFKKMTRTEIGTALKERGANVVGSLSAKTDYLIAGEKAGSKLAKAEKLGVKVLGEADLQTFLSQEATVEVKPKEKKKVELPFGLEGKTFPTFEGRTIHITGSLQSFKKAQLKAILEASGAKISSSVTKATNLVIAGDNWGGRKVRDAIANNVSVLSEGELLSWLDLGGDWSEEHAPDEAIPHGANLAGLEPVASGECKINTPSGVKGELILKWKKVPFQVHRKFGEFYGLEFCKHKHSWLGVLYLDGEQLKPAPKGTYFYETELFRYCHFWEDGSDNHDHSLVFDGKQGFNCTFLEASLKRKKIHVNWEKYFHDDNAHSTEVSFSGGCYGEVVYDQYSHTLVIDFHKKTYASQHFSSPSFISSSNPYGE